MTFDPPSIFFSVKKKKRWHPWLPPSPWASPISTLQCRSRRTAWEWWGSWMVEVCFYQSSGGILANEEIVYFLWLVYIWLIYDDDIFFWSYYENHVTLVLDVLFLNGLPVAKRCREKEHVIWWDIMISFLLDVVSNSSLRRRFHLTSFLDSIYRPKKDKFHCYFMVSMLSFPYHFLFSPSKLFAT